MKEDTLVEAVSRHTSAQHKLKEQLRLLSNNINEYGYEKTKHLFGAVCTVIEASIADPEQRKATKDLVSNALYGQHDNRIGFELEQLAKANGFELWDNTPTNTSLLVEPVNPYEKV